MVNCEQVQEHLSAYHDGMLDAATADAVRGHVATCTHCTETLADYARFDQMLKVAPRVSPDAKLRDRIFASPEFREILESQKPGAAATPAAATVPKIPPRARLGPQAARVWLPVIALIIILSGATAVISKILASRATGPIYATCPTLSGGQRLVYRTGGTLYSSDGRLVCDGKAQVSQWQTSPDGRWVAYLNDRTHTLRLVRADATLDHQIDIGAGGIQSLVWSPDSQRLFFAQTDPKTAGTNTFWAVDTIGARPQLIATLKGFTLDGVPVAAPDGQSLAVAATAITNASDHAIFVFATSNNGAAAANPVQIAVNASITALSWFGGSDPLLTWIAGGNSGNATLGSLHRSAIATPSAAMQQPLGDITAASFSAASGHWAIATLNGALIQVDAATGAQTPLAQLGATTAVQWSPDGMQILATSEQTLWLVTATGATKISDGASAIAPVWNGTTFAFVANGKTQIAQTQGGHITLQTADTDGVGTVAGLRWSPNGGALAAWGSAGIALTSPDGQQLALEPRVADGAPQWTA